jgi:hypothetical protein
VHVQFVLVMYTPSFRPFVKSTFGGLRGDRRQAVYMMRY